VFLTQREDIEGHPWKIHFIQHPPVVEETRVEGDFEESLLNMVNVAIEGGSQFVKH
jgi:hypothetical protein